MKPYFGLPALLLAGIMGLPAQAADSVNVKVLSAVVKDQKLADAKITWQRNGESSQRATSNAAGQASAQLSDDADTTMIIDKEGYSTLVVRCPCDGFTYALSPVMDNLDGLRVVLTWGASPKDLDSHMAFPGSHIYFAKKNGRQANLDVDDTTSYGPETITVSKKQQGKKYIYAVHDFSNASGTIARAMADSQASVQLYVGQTLVRTYRPQPGKNGNSWLVFGIDENGAFQDINSYKNLTPQGLDTYLKDLLASDSFDPQNLVSSADIQQAKRYNTQGEKLYHQQDLMGAMYRFQDAINLYPNFGQAYSNLGLTYQKLDRTAEALWANRKAIELASGKSKDRVQASSYYNIARIYEAKGQWQDALDSYRKAKSLRAHSAYDKGIERMEQKLH